jgi:hypothetical protein
MSQITLDSSLAAKLQTLRDVVEVCDPAGHVLGCFVPASDLISWEPAVPEAAEEELQRREQSNEWYSTEQVFQHLKNLENA